MYDYSRGEIFYISSSYMYQEVDSEQYAGRPAIIVSNDTNNKNSDVVEIVYLTTQPKSDIPTHVNIRSAKKPSIALCEQVNSISKERIGDYIGACTSTEMQMIDAALMISLGLEIPEPKVIEKVVEVEKEAAPKTTTRGRKTVSAEDKLVKAEAERDVYKELYKELLGAHINGGIS